MAPAASQVLLSFATAAGLATGLQVAPAPGRPGGASSWAEGPKVGSLGSTHCFRGGNDFSKDLSLKDAQDACDADEKCAFLWSHRCQGRWWKCYGAAPVGGAADASSCTLVRAGGSEVKAAPPSPPPTEKELERSVEAQLAELSEHLSKMAENSSVTLATLRKDYDQRLAAMWKSIHVSEATNARLLSEIKKADRSNNGLKGYALALKKNSEELEVYLRKLRSNISMAQEFTSKMLSGAGQLLNDSSTMSVLVSMRQATEAAEQVSTLEHRFDEIESYGRAALLQLSESPPERAAVEETQKAQYLVEHLSSSFAKLDSDKESSREMLEKSYEDSLQKVALSNETVLKEQADLNATLASKHSIHDRLEVAIGHLQSTHEHLQASIRGIIGFFKVAGQPPPEAAAAKRAKAAAQPAKLRAEVVAEKKAPAEKPPASKSKALVITASPRSMMTVRPS